MARMEAVPLLWEGRDKATIRISSVASKASNSLQGVAAKEVKEVAAVKAVADWS